MRGRVSDARNPALTLNGPERLENIVARIARGETTYPKALSRAARENYSVNAISLTIAPGNRMLPTVRER